MKITKRWNNLINISKINYDMVEIDESVYACAPSVLDNKEILNSLSTGKLCDFYTVESLKDKRSSHLNLSIMWEAVARWVYRCQCGAEKTKTTHSLWCPKHDSHRK